MTDKSNNQVYLRWLSLLDYFERCRNLSWGSVVLAWTYDSVFSAAHRDTIDIAGCTPLVVSWIYHKFSQWCPPERHVLTYPMAVWPSKVGTSTNKESSDGVWRWISYSYMRRREWGTWMSVVPLIGFNIVEFHHVDRVKRQFGSKQPVLRAPVNVDRFLTTTGRDEDVRWPTRHEQWYDGWRARFQDGYRISIQLFTNYRPTHLLGQEVLDEPRLFDLSGDIQPTANQPRDVLHLPWDVPDCRQSVSEVRADTQRPTRREP
ncbi:hypothetical protein Ahy_B06g080011 [Arachis hypogaea]|uniref:Aminotransferase-like plant mobile domain-containing protein n=1 Tax=Arachis hypogaea TaxID=3818 RepID=A0A444YGV5_ARAHY|nr:hypothetical protein Ahy_B06g080011 [Arachis hypogaea]